ncbi:MAG: transporter substrate-binding domain-containing protein [Azonexus sp.]|jgi:ABC-type amino acid transport substrate-binding protein|uniref:substrate-binding periplasmic protein n=1 Tax=Azonexus sp. TaxID=1872668 RepID=UPI0028175BDF|nr:transporter substrate-binding domain-containing protein [Azonexus sp.]MDR0777245.1 transporter substrate-binding domain-containing protein [Azonexus sp.]
MRWRWVVVLWIGFGAAALASAASLRVALDDQMAALGDDKGNLTAFNEDLAREICRRLASLCEIDHIRYDDILPGVAAGDYDLGFGNYLRTPERERQVAFSRTLWYSSSRLVGRAGQPPDSDLATLRDARVTAIVGTQQHAYLQRLADKRPLTLLGVSTMADAFALLHDGEADFVLLPVLKTYVLLVGKPPGHYRFYGTPLVADGLGGSVHIALPKARNDLRHAVDRAISDMRGDGSYSRLIRRHFPFSLN